MTALHPFSAHARAGQAHLRLMATTDLHVHVLPYDYYTDRPLETVGLSRVAALVRSVRAEATNALMLDNGDFLQGNPMGDYVAHERGMAGGDPHPLIAAMNAVGFDAATLGNHDFNYGLDFLTRALEAAAFPVVSANVATALGATPGQDRTLLPPWVILDRTLTDGAGGTHPIRVGVIGVVPPQVMVWDRRHLEGRVAARDMVDAVRAHVPRMRAAGADIVILLAHSGIAGADAVEGMENAAVPLAAIDGVDAVLTGHQHLTFPGPAFEGLAAVDAGAGTIHGKPAVMAGFWGSHLGVIDLMLERSDAGWRVVGHETGLRPISRRNKDQGVMPLVGDDAGVVASVRADHAATLAYVRRPVGRTLAPLHSYFALVADDPSVRIVAVAQAWYIARMMQGTEWEGLPVLSAAAPFKAGGRGGPDHYIDVPAGDLAIRNVADLYPYPNTIRAVKVTGAQLKDWLERSAGLFNRVVPGGVDQGLLNPDFPSYNFDMISGVRYRIDPSQPSRFDADGAVINPGANRIVDLRHAGQPVDPSAHFLVATNNYRASGGGRFPGALGDTVIFEGPDTNRDVLVRYIADQGTITPCAAAAWTFASLPGTSVLFDTGPRAVGYLGAGNGAAIEPAGEGPDGFARFRLRL